MFFGPAVNAARGIAVQVQNICQQFCSNFQMALNPQLTKSYAHGDLTAMQSLLIKGSKFSFYILFFIALPLMYEAPLVLKLWLGIVPDHTVIFLRLIMVVGLLYTLSNPIIVSVHAVGKLKKFQIVEGSMLLLILPIAYILLKFWGIRPEYVFLVHILIEICTQFVRLKIVLPMIQMKLKDYLVKVIEPVILVIIVAPVIPYFLYKNIEMGYVSFFLVCSLCIVCSSLVIYFLGCSVSERVFLKGKVYEMISKFIG